MKSTAGQGRLDHAQPFAYLALLFEIMVGGCWRSARRKPMSELALMRARFGQVWDGSWGGVRE
jgi:hypothetical protein